jgi:hypothetical protein
MTGAGRAIPPAPPPCAGPRIPQCDPWAVVNLVMHDLSSHGIKSRYGAETDLGEAARHAALLLEALGVAAVTGEGQS